MINYPFREVTPLLTFFAIILGILSLRDYFLAKRGDLNKMILQLPLGIKQRIHKDIKEKTEVGGIIFGSLLAGFLISFLEFGCTGQVYLPTIIFMISKTGLVLKPLFALFLYNIMFIIPLIIIAFLATIFTTKNIAKSLEKKIPTVKFFTAILFFVLGAIMDIMPLLLIGVPILHPIAVSMGIDPIWFAVLVVLVINLGALTPPVGLILFVFKGMAKDIPMDAIYRGSLPFVLGAIVAVAIVFFVPSLATWLPVVLK